MNQTYIPSFKASNTKALQMPYIKPSNTIAVIPPHLQEPKGFVIEVD